MFQYPRFSLASLQWDSAHMFWVSKCSKNLSALPCVFKMSTDSYTSSRNNSNSNNRCIYQCLTCHVFTML